MTAGAAHQSWTSSAPKQRRTIVAFICECQWRAAPRYEGKVHEAAPVEGNLLLHNTEKNDNAIMQPLCECGGVRHDSSAITPPRLRSLKANRHQLGGKHFKALVVCVACCVSFLCYGPRPWAQVCVIQSVSELDSLFVLTHFLWGQRSQMEH